MWLIPIRTVHLVADLPPAAVAGFLRACIGEGLRKRFAGSVGDGVFAIRGFNEFRSTAMPVVRGTLAGAPGGGTAVRLRLRPPPVVAVFLGIWLGFLAAFAGVILAASARTGASLLPLLLPGGLGALTWLLALSVFAAETRWAVAALLEAMPALRLAGPAPASAR